MNARESSSRVAAVVVDCARSINCTRWSASRQTMSVACNDAIRSTSKKADSRQRNHSPEHSPQAATKPHCRSDRSMTAVDLPIETNPLKSFVAFMRCESELRKICMLPWFYSWEPQPLSSPVRRGGAEPTVTIEYQHRQVGPRRHISPITGWAYRIRCS